QSFTQFIKQHPGAWREHSSYERLDNPNKRLGKDLAVFFPINAYDSSNWPTLQNPKRDAIALAKDLFELYGFIPTTYPNATENTIYNSLKKLRGRTYGPDDQLILYFSGHGYFHSDTEEGFFIPSSGKTLNKNSPFEALKSYIPYSQLASWVNSIPCPHILLIVDACRSGTFFPQVAQPKSLEDQPDFLRPSDNNAVRRVRFIRDALRPRSRFAITSGGNTRTSDGITHSPMTKRFLQSLRTLGGHDGVLTIHQLYSDASDLFPRPLMGTFGRHETSGSLLFVYE
ncbi:MAG: caspase family protein, partial [Bacteroidota bacterium]